MKAFLLAGGRGERLRPLTLTCPKCLVPIDGVPLLEIWLDRFAEEGIDEVLLNVSHHAEQVREFLAARTSGPAVELVVEDAPRGSAATVSANRWFVAGADDFWVVYADNLTDASLADMAATHRRHDGILTMGLFRAPNPSAAGIVEMEPDGRIVAFHEKAMRPPGNLANAGMYLARAALLQELPQPGGHVIDFGFDVLPALVGRMFGHGLDGFFMDIGTPEALARASAEWPGRPRRAGT